MPLTLHLILYGIAFFLGGMQGIMILFFVMIAYDLSVLNGR